jgi:hypothetical protein
MRGEADRFLGSYRVFQKIATGLGLFTALVGAGFVLGGRTNPGYGIMALGGVVLLHGFIALGLLRYRDRKTA